MPYLVKCSRCGLFHAFLSACPNQARADEAEAEAARRFAGYRALWRDIDEARRRDDCRRRLDDELSRLP